MRHENDILDLSQTECEFRLIFKNIVAGTKIRYGRFVHHRPIAHIYK